MKSILHSFIIAFSMYSKIPMPKAEWTKENMKYVLCFFPLIGAVIGGIVYLFSILQHMIPMSHVFSSIVMILIPLIITGGIHMDGFLDTTDALCSYQPMEKKLEILKDPHAGAFSIITCVGYYFLTFGIWYDITPTSVPILAISFILSRALSGLSVVTFPLAKNSGLVTTFSNQSKKQITKVVMFFYIIVCIVLLLILNMKLGFICITSAFLVFAYYRHMSYKKFGGITGDLAGYFLQVCELTMALSVILFDRILC